MSANTPFICVDFKAAKQAQLKEVSNQTSDQSGYKQISYEELVSVIINKLKELENQNEYLEILQEVKNRLEQDAQKFEFSSKISQLKSCMKKSKDLQDFLEKNKGNKQMVLKKIVDNFEIIEEDNRICLQEEIEIGRKMNRKYQKLIQKHLEQARIARQILAQVETDPYYQEILDKSGQVHIDFSNSKISKYFAENRFEIDLYSYCDESSNQFGKKIKALGAGLAKNTQIIDLKLDLFGTGVASDRLQAISNGLAKNKKIKKLDINLGGNMMNQSDIQIFNTFLLQNSAVENLDLNLNYNNILGGGLKDLGFGFEKNNSLKSINLQVKDNDISKRGQKLYQSFIKNRTGIQSQINLGVSQSQYEVFKNFHLKRISSIQEIIARQKLQLEFDYIIEL